MVRPAAVMDTPGASMVRVSALQRTSAEAAKQTATVSVVQQECPSYGAVQGSWQQHVSCKPTHLTGDADGAALISVLSQWQGGHSTDEAGICGGQLGGLIVF